MRGIYMNKKDNNNKHVNLEDNILYENLNFNDLDSLSGDMDNTLTNLFLSLSVDDIKKDIKNKKNK
jgi:hypothetical protein